MNFDSKSAKLLLESTFKKILNNKSIISTETYEKSKVDHIINNIESIISQSSKNPTDYAVVLLKVNLHLTKQIGIFPEDITALMLIKKEITIEEIIEQANKPETDICHRDESKKLFARLLYASNLAYSTNKELTVKTAIEIENSCYNAVIKTSKNTRELLRRHWDSAPFTCIYHTRCGTIADLLDINSTTCQIYGNILIDKLLSGELNPNLIGDMTVGQICTNLFAPERAEIEARLNQVVPVKESNLFKCPHCGMRKCTYIEVQRRALDEAPDYTCICLNCNHRFTGRN